MPYRQEAYKRTVFSVCYEYKTLPTIDPFMVSHEYMKLLLNHCGAYFKTCFPCASCLNVFSYTTTVFISGVDDVS